MLIVYAALEVSNEHLDKGMHPLLYISLGGFSHRRRAIVVTVGFVKHETSWDVKHRVFVVVDVREYIRIVVVPLPFQTHGYTN
tara:strand:+ start:659 stop:907 length:249 start_codon:yes stop_codon:yes gene_type:complete